MLHIISRSYGGENKKERPDYYSKRLSLLSLIKAFQQLAPGTAELIFINDGPIPEDRLELMRTSGEVIMRSNLGGLGSVTATLDLPIERGWHKDDLVWFAEDDYLYLPRALTDLVAAANAFPKASYLGLYALIGMQQPNGVLFDDPIRMPRGWSDSEVTLVNGHPWRRALSTTSTYGVRVEALVEDYALMKVAMRSGGAWDHTIALMCQGFTPYPAKSLLQTLLGKDCRKSLPRRAAICGVRMGLNVYSIMRMLKPSRHRTLVAPEIALISHMETEHMAVGTDWRAVAAQFVPVTDAVGNSCLPEALVVAGAPREKAASGRRRRFSSILWSGAALSSSAAGLVDGV